MGSAPTLPANFVFGTATSATQIEGGSALDGRTASLWDVFAALPGRIADASSNQLAIDHYRRWPADLDLLADLGVQAYRMSLSWSRIQPGGSGPMNPAGLAHYDRIVDRLLENGIAPYVALDHWDMPLEVMERGGWLTRQTTEAFAHYADLVAGVLGDRVAAWITLVEPLVHMAYGYAVGIDAPGLTLLGGAFSATHHQLLAHGRATQALRSRSSAPVGIINHHTVVEPASHAGADVVAARFYDDYHNRQFADPLLRGSYPRAVLEMPGAATDVIEDGDLELISAPLDFYGVSYAHPTTVAAAPQNSTVPFSLEVPSGRSVCAAGWPIDPGGLTSVLTDLHRRYPQLPPIHVTGIGGAFDDVVIDGRLQPDDDRIHYLDGHLDAIAMAIDRGCPVSGYFHWSLFDSWEWAEGFDRHFGLIGVDPNTLERTPRASFQHYRDLIGRHGS